MLVTPLVAYLAWMAVLFAAQRKLLFPGTSLEGVQRAGEGVPGLVRLWLQAGDARVEAWYLPPRGPAPAGASGHPAAIFTHGNYELIDFWAFDFERLRDHGVGVLLVELPGYGRSGGTPSEPSIRALMGAAFDSLVARPDVDPARVVAWGRSVGGGAACALADVRPVAALVLQSTFTGVRRFALRYLAPPFLVRDRFDNLGVVGRFEGPVLVAHGRNDRLIPFSHGAALAAASPRGTLRAYDCAHDDCPPEWEPFLDEVAAFLTRNGVL